MQNASHPGSIPSVTYRSDNARNLSRAQIIVAVSPAKLPNELLAQIRIASTHRREILHVNNQARASRAETWDRHAVRTPHVNSETNLATYYEWAAAF